jgi:hypothetical protein
VGGLQMEKEDEEEEAQHRASFNEGAVVTK